MNHLSDPSLVNFLVGTLNFSASVVSPYEFHESQTIDNSLFEYKLNEAFRNEAKKQFPNFDQPNFDWGMAAMDLVWKNRFSPFYRIDAGAAPNGRMMNEQQFLAEWDRQSQNVRNKIIQEGVQKLLIKGSKLPKQQIAQNLQKQLSICRQYDLLGYKAFIKVIYGIDDITNLNVSSEKYLKQRQSHFGKVFLKQEYKKQSTVQMIRGKGYDIFCMQEIQKNFVHELRQSLTDYVIVEMPNKLSQICDSVILLKKEKFPDVTEHTIELERQNFLNEFVQRIKNPSGFSKKLSAETMEYLNSRMQDEGQKLDEESLKMKIHKQFFWNDDTCYCIIGPLIVFSPHISTKKGRNEQQINQIKETITKILTYFPEKYFICAGDLNGDFDNKLNLRTADKMFIKVSAFPSHDDDVTCNKMRTLTQAQRVKALQISFCKKDYIITDLKLVDTVVEMADGTKIQKKNAPLIPNQRHPFDHFVVSATVRMTDRIVSSSPLLKRDKLSKSFDGYMDDTQFA